MKDQKKKAFKAQVDTLTEDMSMSEASVASLVEQIALLKAELAVKADKLFLDIPNTTKIKQNYLIVVTIILLSQIYHIQILIQILPLRIVRSHWGQLVVLIYQFVGTDRWKFSLCVCT